jgi:hypothetical protein
MKQEQLLLHRPHVRRLAILHWEELEILEALIERGESILDMLSDWQKSDRKAMPLKNWIIANRPDLQRPVRMRDGKRLREILDAAAAAAPSAAPASDE